MESPAFTKRPVQQEAGPRQGQSTPQSRVEECEEPVGDESGQAQPEAERHHEGHDQVALKVQEAQEVQAFCIQASNPLGILHDELAEHCVEGEESGNSTNNKCDEDANGRTAHFNGRTHTDRCAFGR